MAQNDKANIKSKSGEDYYSIVVDLDDLIERKEALVEKEIQEMKNGVTTKELAGLWCISQRTAQKRIKQMISEGDAFMAGKEEHIKSDGTKGHSPLYILKK